MEVSSRAALQEEQALWLWFHCLTSGHTGPRLVHKSSPCHMHRGVPRNWMGPYPSSVALRLLQ